MRISAYFITIIGIFLTCSLKAASELLPHRAYYTITMASRPSPSSSLVDLRGTMMIEMDKTYDGWTVQQLSEVWRYHEDESSEHSRWGYVIWEKEDGSLLKFHTFRKVNGELVEDIQGTAQKKGGCRRATYKKPEPDTLDLPEGVLFPVQHTKELLKAAQEGEHIFSQVVFDGSSTDGPFEINTFIGAQKVRNPQVSQNKAPQFETQPFWPIRFSVYGLGKTGYEADYVTTQELLPNGIVKQYVIDDGTVKIRGVLERIEFLK